MPYTTFASVPIGGTFKFDQRTYPLGEFDGPFTKITSRTYRGSKHTYKVGSIRAAVEYPITRKNPNYGKVALTPADRSVFERRLGIGAPTRRYKAGRPDLASRMGPARRMGRYAVLVCFDGPQAKLAAEDYLKYVTMAEKAPMARMSSPSDRIRFMRFDAHPCCLALHDCVQHPLNPQG